MKRARPFRTVVADPAWLFKDKLPGKSRGASKNYYCMKLAQLCTLTLPRIHDDAFLFLWRVGAMQREALAVGRAWAFGDPTSDVVWVKTKDRNRPASSVRMGMGRRTVRNAHEICLVYARGKAKRLDAGVLSLLFAPRPGRGAGEHSRKPDAFYELVERLCPGPYLELFARRERPGWTCIGDELGQVLV